VDIWLPTSTGSFYYKQSLYPNECPAGNNCNYWGWSNVISGDFNGDGNIDLAFGRQAVYGLYYEANSWGEIDYWPGNGDGTFGGPQVLASDGGGPHSFMGVSPQLIVVNDNTLVAFSSNIWKTEYTSGDLCWHIGAPCWHPVYIPKDAMASANDGYLWTFLPISQSNSQGIGNVLFGNFRNSLSSFLVPYYTDDNTTQFMVFTNVFGNRSLRSTTVPGIFNPISANYFDSHLDVAGTYSYFVSGNTNNGVAIFFGNGDNTFNNTPLIIPDPPGYTSSDVHVADFNGDNKPDIVAAMSTTTHPGEMEIVLNSTNPKTPTVSVASSLNPSTEGGTVTFTATVTPNPLNWPREAITFYSGPNRLGPAVKLVNGTASVSTAKLPPGTHTITAAYSGDCCDYLPASASLIQLVNK
jgi:hypothetical protein